MQIQGSAPRLLARRIMISRGTPLRQGAALASRRSRGLRARHVPPCGKYLATEGAADQPPPFCNYTAAGTQQCFLESQQGPALSLHSVTHSPLRAPKGVLLERPLADALYRGVIGALPIHESYQPVANTVLRAAHERIGRGSSSGSGLAKAAAAVPAGSASAAHQSGVPPHHQRATHL